MLEARFRHHFAVAVVLAALLGCQKTYYTMLEQVGVEKRELLTKRIGRAKESQQEAEQEFRDALEKFQALTGHGGGDLEDRYDRLRSAFDRSEEQAREVNDRIDAVESVANDLIDEWKEELDRYQDRSLRRRSEARLHEMERELDRLLGAMHRAERSLDPVLEKFEDRVLYVKHNLNAAALAGLQDDLPEIERDVGRLVREMQASITEADRFIAQND
jgi:chromosome segregation ATPase